MAQAIVLQSEILAKDLTVINGQWMDALRNQERYQVSYQSKMHELIETTKRQRQQQQQLQQQQNSVHTNSPESAGRISSTATASPASATVSAEAVKSKQKDINEG